MKEMKTIKGRDLVLIKNGALLCGYKIRKEVFKHLCETMVGTKDVPNNLLFERQQSCEDGVRFTDGDVTIWLPYSAMLFTFQVRQELTPPPVMETLAKEMIGRLTGEQLEALGKTLTPHGEEAQEVKHTMAELFASSQMFQQNPYAPVEGRNGKFWRIPRNGRKLTDQDILEMNFDVEEVPEMEREAFPRCDKRGTYLNCLALPTVDERIASNCSDLLIAGKCPRRLDKTEREKFVEDFPEEARARTFDGGI